MPLAALKISLGTIDETKGIIPACRLAEVNRLATFMGKDGNPVELMITPGLIDGLLGLAKTAGRLDAYWTHDRLSGESSRDVLHDSVGVWRNFRKDESGNLVADIQLEPSAYKDRIIWKAQNDPDGIMTSMVFRYEGGKTDAKPTRLDSADFVRFGAATTRLRDALLSAYPQNQQTTIMDEKLKKEITDLITAALANFKPAPATPDVAGETAQATALMSAAGVTDADKLAEDKDKPILVQAQLAIARANKRQIAATEDGAVVKAQAALTGVIGTTVKEVIQGAANDAGKDFEAALSVSLAAGAPNRAVAIARLAREKPAIYNAARAAGKI